MRTVGRYELLEEIGRGGAATVHLARQLDLDRLVALKELRAFSTADPSFARRFVRESRLMSGLNHPNLVTVYDYFEADGAPYIAMEYLAAGSLRACAGRLRFAAVAGAMEGILGGVGHAHAHGIVHRDLKPENVLVTDLGGVKVADFGIAKAINSLQTAITATGTTIGTPTYMAPEQALGRQLGPPADLYSIGIMAFELLAGRPPFGDAEPVAILMRHVQDEAPPLATMAPSTPPAVAEWVAQLLRKAPGERPQSASEAWDGLEEIVLDLLGPRWRRQASLTADGEAPTPTPTRTPRTVARARTVPPTPVAAAATARRHTRSRALPARSLAALLVTALAVAIVAMMVLGSGSAPRDGATRPASATAAGGVRHQPARGVGDSQSDDPSDDEPDGAEP